MTESNRYDAVIIGAGAAGAQCALWLRLLGFRPLLVERADAPGGLLNRNPYPNHWNVLSPPMSGHDATRQMRENLERHGVESRYHAPELRWAGETRQGCEITLGEETLHVSFLVLATGVRPISGGLPPSRRIVIGPGDEVERSDVAGKRVAVLGGGDNAAENYAFLKARGASSITMHARTLRARPSLLEAIPPENIKTGPYTVDADRMTVDGEAYDLFFVFYGWQAVNPLEGQIELALDEKKFIAADRHCRTSHPRIYAIGECSQRTHPCTVTSMADGVIAAKDIETRLKR